MGEEKEERERKVEEVKGENNDEVKREETIPAQSGLRRLRGVGVH